MRLYNTRFRALCNFISGIRSPPLKCDVASRPMLSGSMIIGCDSCFLSGSSNVAARGQRLSLIELDRSSFNLLCIETYQLSEKCFVLYLQEVGKVYGKNGDISNLRKTFENISGLGKSFD